LERESRKNKAEERVLNATTSTEEASCSTSIAFTPSPAVEEQIPENYPEYVPGFVPTVQPSSSNSQVRLRLPTLARECDIFVVFGSI